VTGRAQEIRIAGRAIGPDHPPYLIAEMSGNHNGDLARALAIVEAAAEAGADAVKLQTYTADTITIDNDGPGFRIEGGLWAGRTLHDLYEEAHTPWAWHEAIFAKGRELGIAVFSAPFDATAIDLLESLGAPAYKIASFEIVDLALIRRVAETGKPMIVSTGMASLAEIVEAVQAAREAGAEEIAVLHCTSGYPTPPEDSNLRTIPHLGQATGTVVGLSDHTQGIAAPMAAIALGASLIEKHMTLDRADGGPDSAFSLEPAEFAALTEGCRLSWQALGEVSYARQESEKGNSQFRRSLYITQDVAAGEVFTPDNLRSIRPGLGLEPRYLDLLLGRRARRALARGTPVTWDLLLDDE
jgi:pseudaminic acid synthase